MSALRVVDVTPAVSARRVRDQARLLWVGGAGLLSLALTVRPFADTGSWAQLALGRVITAHGLPSTEPFSSLPAMQPWVAPGWLHDALLAALVGAGGVTLASLALGLAASVGLVVASLSIRPGARVPGPWLAAGVLAGAFVARPFLLGGVPILVLGSGTVLYILARAREGEPRLLWILAPVFLLWANLDGSFVAGLGIVLLAWLVETPRHAALRRTMLLTLAAGAVAAVINPAGAGLYQSLLTSAGSHATSLLSATVGSPDFHDWSARLFEAAAAALIVAWVAGGGPSRRDAVLAIAVITLALWSQQFIPLFAVLAMPQLALYGWRAWHGAVAPRLPRSTVAATIRRILGIATATPPSRLLLSGAALAGAAVVAIAAIVVQAGPHGAASAEATHEPQAAATRVAAAYPGQRLYAPSTWGDYLVSRFPSGRVVVIYGASGGFTDASASTYMTIHTIAPGWEAAVRNTAIRVAVVGERSQEAGALHELGWAADCVDNASGALVLTAPASGAPATPTSDLAVPPRGVRAC